MTVTRVLDGLGSWSLILREGTPQPILDDLAFYGHVAIIPGRHDVEAYGDALLAGARYVGVIREIGKDEPRDIGGQGTLVWLGDEDDKGHVIEAPVTLTNGTLAAWIAALLPPSVHIGTINAQPVPAARHTNTYTLMSPRKAIGLVCAAFGVEFRVNGDSTIDVGTQAQLYNPAPRTDGRPTPIISRRPGTDVDLHGVEGDMDVDTAVYDYSTDVVLLGRTEEGTGEIVTGRISAPSVPYVDRWGNPVKFTRVISESGETEGTVSQRAQLQINRFNRVTRTFALEVDEYQAEGPINVGDYAFVYDPELGIRNPANEQVFRGEVIWPDAIRISEHTWPVTAGNTVGYRNGAGTWTDLTPYVTWETGGGQITVGDLPKSLSRPSESAIDRRVDVARATAPDGTTPKAPTGLMLATDAYVTPAGTTAALIAAEWIAPTANTDDSALIDFSHYEIAVRWTGRGTVTPSAATTDTDVEVLGLATNLEYEVTVRAVDRSGNQSAPATAFITTADDDIAPPAPADPVLSSFLGQLQIEYIGTTAAATPWPSDTKQINVHIGAPGFTVSPSNRVDALPPNGQGFSIMSTVVGVPTAVRLQAEDHSGNLSAPSAEVVGASQRVTSDQIASLEVGKLTSGTVNAVVVIANRLTTALIGQRAEMWSGGFRAFNSAEDMTVDIDGVTNYLRGTFEAGEPGQRRVIISSSFDAEHGTTGGGITFVSPDGAESHLRSFTAGGEGLSLSVPVGSGVAYASWNSVQVNDQPGVYLVSRNVNAIFGVGGTAGVGVFLVESTSSATISSAGVRKARYQVDATNHAWWPAAGPSGSRGVMTFGTVTSTINHSPLLTLANGQNFGASFRYYADTGGGNPQIGVVNPNDSGYHPVVASAFTVSSDEVLKKSIKPVTGVLAALMDSDMRPVEFDWKEPRAAKRRKGDDSPRHGRRPRQFGMIAQQVPKAMRAVGPDGIATIDLGAGVAYALGSVKELAGVTLPAVERLLAILPDLERIVATTKGTP